MTGYSSPSYNAITGISVSSFSRSRHCTLGDHVARASRISKSRRNWRLSGRQAERSGILFAAFLGQSCDGGRRARDDGRDCPTAGRDGPLTQTSESPNCITRPTCTTIGSSDSNQCSTTRCGFVVGPHPKLPSRRGSVLRSPNALQPLPECHPPRRMCPCRSREPSRTPIATDGGVSDERRRSFSGYETLGMNSP